ncbi:GDSL esterase/lipase At5g55050 [Linum perenne]
MLWVLIITLRVVVAADGETQKVPAMYVFGDSLVDVGNNNYLPLSFSKANYPHNGIDFPTNKSTGRFSNGKNSADCLAEKFEVASSPPYLSMDRKNVSAFLGGVSFASGGALLLNRTSDQVPTQWINMAEQVSYYQVVYKQILNQSIREAQYIISKSIFLIVIGSNDIFRYSNSSSLLKQTIPPQQSGADTGGS